MHTVLKLIKQVNKTHRGLGPLVATNVMAAKAKKSLLIISPSGCGKSSATDTTGEVLKGRVKQFTSLTLAGMMRLKEEFTDTNEHVLIDDLGEEKSQWSRISTITVLANLVYKHFIDKVTHEGRIQITNFTGSVALNIQPVLMNTLVQTDEWVSVIRDKVTRYYHLIRPIKPKYSTPQVTISWGAPLNEVTISKHKGKLYYELVGIGLTQWSYARVNEHIPDYLKALAALDGRTKVALPDYKLLIKLLQPLRLERYIVETYGFEAGRVFDNNLYCVLVELASFKEPTLEQIAIDYKVSIKTAERLIQTASQYCFIKTNSPKHVLPTPQTAELLNEVGVYQRW